MGQQQQQATALGADTAARLPGRPLGDISCALALAAQVRPGTVRDLAQRAQVGYRAARYTASRMLERGDLVRIEKLPPTDRRRWPPVLGAPPCPNCETAPGAGEAAGADMQRLLLTWAKPHQR